MLHAQINDDMAPKIELKVELTLLIYGYHKCMFVHFFFNYLHRFFHLCLLLSVRQSIKFVDIVQSLLNMCGYGISFFILN